MDEERKCEWVKGVLIRQNLIQSRMRMRMRMEVEGP
jgi:hypothetical protein